jgi:cystathionine beta-lyase/cystathionine gamma-synthase
MKFGTRLIHNGNELDKQTGALSIPIYQASTYEQSNIEARQEFIYSRSGNPTRKALENTITYLEGGYAGFAFASGMAATASVLATFSAHDHIIICEDVYGGTYGIATSFFNRFDLDISFVDATNVDNIARAINPKTRAIFLETPSNPLLKITDIKSVVALAKEKQLLTMIDNTFMSPCLQRPLELGMDIVIHSATKFIGGHSDVLGGLVVARTEELAHKIYDVQSGFGAVLWPQDSWLLLRGLKTLKIRMEAEQKTTGMLADWLAGHRAVREVYYPGLARHPGREIHYAQADGAGAVLAFRCKTQEKAVKFLQKVKLGVVAVSLGGVETIISYPAKMSHASVPLNERCRLGIHDDLLRVSVGLEDIEDLLEDFDRALA